MDTILITTSSFGVMDAAPLAALRRAGYEPVLNPHGRKLTEAEGMALHQEHSPVGLLAGVEPLTREVMLAGGRLRAIARCGIGMDSVDAGAARDLGIALTNTPDAPTQAVAEITLGAILCMLRGIHNSCAGIRSGNWERPMGVLLAYRTVGLLGLGRIGSRLAELLRPFGCRILGHDPYAPPPQGVEAVGFDQLLAEADLLSVHVPYSEATRHILGEAAIRAMKPGAFVVNYARGGLVDEVALDAALAEGRLAGAAIDCFEREPYAGPLVDRPGAVLTGHIGSYAREGRIIQETQAVENLLNSLARPTG
ncbi:MAG: phosphoglycerate dehydrogenase [Pseudodesulfovibrio sp.]|uniref:D-isomer specific 2-hydroxyacid dehydrogenase NAD-binding protein n=1 Tax=Pseudodesulfovibrio aespoeensis (strain ATCC 700646 / DSM 10631 / Aspo-2) TaxID=643562 RepID=E6VUI5_PSEA9|nr:MULTISPECIES: phosphoglycerate dehydrogenase [Pseudodesulfovibrio]MBU4192641.1 phosphoglycerate dehydrogenase [Pseudomonadota bacterium]ADU61130.1 D-isomer specific 2-hydroxyacid dehydrogenase NAD-binding protein [Pseudodesulfovibrio aespoeensis Aspo-2]MBU4244281.1 phosphoglycerate dehydrogenase [Pseudomonadota bacterium]MBU4476745.1 phosphoglycerate dehydrogenase [Pseudomonadota bacterium]MBU4517067.1 phosphoglycerate dehydrogenase [Pseudomonadota bacterium]